MHRVDLLNTLLDTIRNSIKLVVHNIAVALNKMTGGKLSANVITYVGLVTHIPIAWLIAQQQNYIAAGLLVFFGLFDTLDGALARLQKTAGNQGMLLDASTDRMKEVLLYTGAASALVASGYQS